MDRTVELAGGAFQNTTDEGMTPRILDIGLPATAQ
jgi:hypothetical protein